MKAFSDIDIEKAVLSAITNNKLALFEYWPMLRVNDFVEPVHQEYFMAICYIKKSGKDLDLVMLSNWMNEKGSVLKRDDLFDISGFVTSADHIKSHVDTLIDLSQRRSLIGLCNEINQGSFDEDKTTLGLLVKLSNGINDISQRGNNEIKPNKEISQSIQNRIRDLQLGHIKLQGLSGLRNLDKYLLCEDGELITFASASNVGKSWLANNIAANTDSLGQWCLLVSMEMTAEMVGQRLLSLHSGYNANDFREGNIDLSLNNVQKSLKYFEESKILISDKGCYTIHELESLATKYKVQNKLDLLIIDHGLLMNFGNRDSTADRISAVSKRLKGLAKTLSIKIVLFWQLTKEAERAVGGRPNKSHIKNTGSIYEDSDRVVMLWRPERYGVEQILIDGSEMISTENIIVGIIEKNRHGEVGKDVPLKFYPTKGGLFDLEESFSTLEQST